MMNIYIYPTYTPSRDKSGNKYIKYFHEAFQSDGYFCVLNRLWKIGITSLLFNLDAEIFVVHWVDLIPYKRLGKLQFVIFLFVTSIVRLLGKKMVWVLHNKHSHKGKSRIVDLGMKHMARCSSLVIAHAREGVDFFNNKYPRYKGKCCYLPHPVYNSSIFESKEQKWDFIIWGGISRRKHIYEFLHFANSQPFFSDKTILICGSCSDEEYSALIQNETNSHVKFINHFLSDDELKIYIQQSRIILFTYCSDSLLSSGALIYSLNFGKPIIGPHMGNFADLEGIVTCYRNFEDIPKLQVQNNIEKLRDFIEHNSWDNFPRLVLKKLNTI